MIIVLVTTGKHESVDSVKVKLFEERFQAEDYCTKVNTGRLKYWTKAEIVPESTQVELDSPE